MDDDDLEQVASLSLLQNMVLSAVFAGLIAIGAWLRFELPISPVPITLQTMFLFLAALILPPAWATASVGLYIFAGLIGLPVFAGGIGGVAVILGPSGGFLIGFLFATPLVSLISVKFQEGRIPEDVPGVRVFSPANASRIFSYFMFAGDILALISGSFIIYGWGYPWIVQVLDWDWRIGLSRAVLPFLPGDTLKIVAAALLAVPARKIILRNVRNWSD